MKSLLVVLLSLLLVFSLSMTVLASSLYVDGIFTGEIDSGSETNQFMMNLYGGEVIWNSFLVSGEMGVGNQKDIDSGVKLYEIKTGYRFIKKTHQNLYLSVSHLNLFTENNYFKLNGDLLGIKYVATNSDTYYFSFSWDLFPLSKAKYYSNDNLVSDNEGLQSIKARLALSVLENMAIGAGYRSYPTKDKILNNNFTLGITYMFDCPWEKEKSSKSDSKDKKREIKNEM